MKSWCTWRGRVSEMLGGGRQFVELVDDEAEQPVARCSALRVAQSYFNKIMRRRPVFLVMFELVCPKLFYGWVVVFACGIGWWCVAPAATFGVGVYVNYWLSDPGETRALSLLSVAVLRCICPGVLSYSYMVFCCHMPPPWPRQPLCHPFAAMEVLISRSLLSTFAPSCCRCAAV